MRQHLTQRHLVDSPRVRCDNHSKSGMLQCAHQVAKKPAPSIEMYEHGHSRRLDVRHGTLADRADVVPPKAQRRQAPENQLIAL